MTEQELQSLIEEFHVPLHIRRHSEKVTEFALELGKKLVEAGENIDLELLKQAASLHDIVRIVDFRNFNPQNFKQEVTEKDLEVWEALRKKYSGMHHAIAAAQILRERGYEKIAQVVEKHRYLQIKDGFNTWEEKLLYYSDKRVKHDQIVPLEERLNDGRERNAPETKNLKETLETDQKVFALESEIMAKIKR
ncbi:MAG: HD domain-containing protein [Candidatus Gracilibacteria bacterium]